jgi:hypothetical protein
VKRRPVPCSNHSCRVHSCPYRSASASAQYCFGKLATKVGTAANNTIKGTSGNDVIVGLGGNDTIYGGGSILHSATFCPWLCIAAIVSRFHVIGGHVAPRQSAPLGVLRWALPLLS